MTNHKKEAQLLWAKHKYFVLSRSQKHYRTIRQYLKNDSIDINAVKQMIVETYTLPENRGEMINCAMHIWGYFKNKATSQEKMTYMQLLDNYRNGHSTQYDLLSFFKQLLYKYPNQYLNHSSIFTNEKVSFFNLLN